MRGRRRRGSHQLTWELRTGRNRCELRSTHENPRRTLTVLTSRGGYVAPSADSQAEEVQPDGPNVIRVWTPQLGKSNMIRRIMDYACYYFGAAWNLVTMKRQDVVISLTTPPFILAAVLLHRLLHPRTCVVLWNMDCYPEVLEAAGLIKKDGFISRTIKWLNRLLLGSVDHVVCLDTAMRKLLTESYSTRRKWLSTSVIPNWESLSMFPKNRETGSWDEAEVLGLRDRFVVLYLGNMGFGHRFDTIVEAAKRLRDEPVTFLFVGGGKRWSELKQAKEEHQLDNLLLKDYVPKELTPTVMKTADCALITLHEDSLGVMSPSKLHANLAAGLPVLYVGPEHSNVDDAISRFECGRSVRSTDVDGVVSFVSDLAQDSQRLELMQQSSRHAFESAYCDTQTLPQFDRCLRTVMEQAAASRPVPVFQRLAIWFSGIVRPQTQKVVGSS